MDKWTIGQKLAWDRFCAGMQQWRDNIDKIRFTSQGDYEAFSYMMYEKQQEQEYVFWFINNNPHLIEDDGRIMPQINTGNGLQYVSWKDSRVAQLQEKI